MSMGERYVPFHTPQHEAKSWALAAFRENPGDFQGALDQLAREAKDKTPQVLAEVRRLLRQRMFDCPPEELGPIGNALRALEG